MPIKDLNIQLLSEEMYEDQTGPTCPTVQILWGKMRMIKKSIFPWYCDNTNYRSPDDATKLLSMEISSPTSKQLIYNKFLKMPMSYIGVALNTLP